MIVTLLCFTFPACSSSFEMAGFGASSQDAPLLSAIPVPT
jgi:hypothetical protein